MAITFAGNRRYFTGLNGLGGNQDRCGVGYFFRYDGDPTLAAGVFPFARGPFAGPGAQITVSPGGGKLRVYHTWKDAAGTDIRATYDYMPGVHYYVMMTWDQGAQFLIVNGVPIRMGSATGKTLDAGGKNWIVGGATGSPTAAASLSMQTLALWHGYAPTPQDAADLRDGTKTPAQIGGGTLKALWTLDGPTGATPVKGDPGLINSTGVATYDLVNTDGTGTAVYGPAITWAPAARSRPYVSTCGTLIGVEAFGKVSGDQVAITQHYTLPSVSLNGAALAPGRDPWVSGFHERMLFRLPEGVRVQPGDAVSISAPSGWANTDVGLAEAMVNVPAENHVGESCFGTDDLPKTLPQGVNFAFAVTGLEVPYCLQRNMRYRLSQFTGATHTKDGLPVEMSRNVHIADWYWVGDDNGIDDTQNPGPLGLHAIGWNERDPANPTTFAFVSGLSRTDRDDSVVIVERVDLRNDGIERDGVIYGKVRVFDIQAAPGATVVRRAVSVAMSNPGPLPRG
jgi:hypothetical protein